MMYSHEGQIHLHPASFVLPLELVWKQILRYNYVQELGLNVLDEELKPFVPNIGKDWSTRWSLY